MSSSSDTPLACNAQELEKEVNKEGKSKSEGNPECAVCLQTSIHPVQLPCNHVFCYLCVKGVANQSKRCAMCRQEIPSDFLENPHLLACDNLESDIIFEGGYQWFYEGRNGWWQYDERTSIELETAYKRGVNRCEVLIAGFLYIIDFEHMVQMRQCDTSRRRRIKRDLATVPKKGVAGIRIPSHSNNSSIPEQNISSRNTPVTDQTNGTENETFIGRNESERQSSNCESSSLTNRVRRHTEGSSESVTSSYNFISTDSIVEGINSMRLSENGSIRNSSANNGRSNTRSQN